MDESQRLCWRKEAKSNRVHIDYSYVNLGKQIYSVGAKEQNSD